MINSRRRLKNCGTTCTSLKKRNTITSKELTDRNTTSTSFASVSTSTWASSRNRNVTSQARRLLAIKESVQPHLTSSDHPPNPCTLSQNFNSVVFALLLC
uniref:Uncharacterized protein n=1 Tax=Ciona intestinalis TaxID=7719 RepID=F6VRR2_CIOIN